MIRSNPSGFTSIDLDIQHILSGQPATTALLKEREDSAHP